MVLFVHYSNAAKQLCFTGPLTILSQNRLVLIGVASIAITVDGDPETPSLFSRVSAVLDWIRENSDVAKWQCE